MTTANQLAGIINPATGQIYDANAPSGSVIQVVTDTTGNTGTTTSTSYIDDGLEVTITPSSASNRIVVIVHSGCSVAGGYAYFRIRETTTNTTVAEAPHGNFSNGSPQQLEGVHLVGVFQLSNTSAKTFKLQGANSGGTRYINYGNDSSPTMVVMEISA